MNAVAKCHVRVAFTQNVKGVWIAELLCVAVSGIEHDEELLAAMKLLPADRPVRQTARETDKLLQAIER